MTSRKQRSRSVNFTTLERGRFHLILRQSVREDGRLAKRPVLWLVVPDGAGLIKILRYQPLLEYFADNAAMSYKWMHNAARGIGALVDHSLAIAANAHFHTWREQGVLQRRLLRGLARSLVNGTMRIGPDGRIVDATGLY